ncbi:MAG: helix-turn-helix domain-containing protein, partial [Planctomycetota bacterium]
MRELSPKQREIRSRERRILDAAFPLLSEGGIDAIRMDRIAESIGCTRGTVYNHFRNREEILIALASRAVARRNHLFAFARTLGPSSRFRCQAIGLAAEVYADQMPNDFLIEQVTRHDPVWQKASPQRQQLLAES